MKLTQTSSMSKYVKIGPPKHEKGDKREKKPKLRKKMKNQIFVIF